MKGAGYGAAIKLGRHGARKGRQIFKILSPGFHDREEPADGIGVGKLKRISGSAAMMDRPNRCD
jgi:hypothetical protein